MSCTTRTEVEFTAKRIIIETPLSIGEVVSRLNDELSAERAGPKLIQFLRTVSTREELERGIHEISRGRDFVLFSQARFHLWRNAYGETNATPHSYQYTFGNPLIAQTMIQHDPHAMLHVPLRALVVAKPDGSGGTQIIYMLPSSVIALPVGPNRSVDQALKDAALKLDERLEALFQKVTEVLPKPPSKLPGRDAEVKDHVDNMGIEERARM